MFKLEQKRNISLQMILNFAQGSTRNQNVDENCTYINLQE